MREQSFYPAWRTIGLPLSGLLLLVVAIFADMLFAGGTRVLGNRGTDLFFQFVAWRDFGFRELAKGHLALWNPHILSGAPYFGGWQAALLYPPNWLFLILPLPAAINWSIALHVFAIGAFMFFWMRLRGLTVTASWFAGVLIMFCGAHFLHIYAGHLTNLSAMVWAPLIFCSIDGLLDSRDARWGLLGMFAGAMQMFAGQPQYVFYSATIAGLYALLRLAEVVSRAGTPDAATAGQRGRVLAAMRTPQLLLALLAIYPGAVALSAVQVLTGLQAARETIRSVPLPFDYASICGLPPENFLTLVASNFLGDSGSYWGRCYLWETSLFIGVTGFLLAVYATVAYERRAKWIPLTVLGVALLLALGVHTPLFGFLYAFVPGFNRFRSIAKFIFPASLFLVLLAAMGLDRLMKDQKTVSKFVLCALVLAGVLTLGGLWTVRTGSWHGLMGAVEATGEHYLHPPGYGSVSFGAQAQRNAAMSLFLAAGVSALCGGFGAWMKSDARMRFVIVALGVIEVFAFANGARATFDSTAVVISAEKRFLFDHPGDYRIINLANPNSSMLIGAADLWGYDPGVVRRYAEFVAWTQGRDPDQVKQYVEFVRVDPLYAMLRLQYIFALHQNELRVTEAASPPMPHVQLVSSYRLVQSRDAIFRALRADGFDPRREVVLERAPNPRPGGRASAGSARIVAASTDALTIEADAEHPAILLITDVFTPAWRAVALPGSTQAHYEVEPANYVLRAVPLAAGHHRLRIVYEPPAFAIGKWITIFASLTFIATCVWLLR
jgi:hypothetical protein